MNKKLIKLYYHLSIYTDTDLDAFVASGDITEEERLTMINDG